jgi:CHASE2 domain-containing sensor protein
MLDFLLPTTDAGVAVQFAVWATASVGGFIATRKNKDVRLLIIGLSILALGLLSVRAIH